MGIREYFDPLSGRPDNDAERERWLRHVDALAARMRREEGWRRIFSANPRDWAERPDPINDPLAERMARLDAEAGSLPMSPPLNPYMAGQPLHPAGYMSQQSGDISIGALIDNWHNRNTTGAGPPGLYSSSEYPLDPFPTPPYRYASSVPPIPRVIRGGVSSVAPPGQPTSPGRGTDGERRLREFLNYMERSRRPNFNGGR